jgi:hypothetical protein
VLAIGLAALLWTATGAVIAPFETAAPAEARDASTPPPREDPRPRAELEDESERLPAPTNDVVTAPASRASEPRDDDTPTAREDAVEPVLARVHGTTVELREDEETVKSPPARAGLATDPRPIPGVRLRFSCNGRVVHTVEVGRDGRFDARFVAQGPCALAIESPQGWEPSSPPVELDDATLRGERELPLCFARRPLASAGAVRGFLASESGAWSPESLPKTGAVLLDLVAVDDPFLQLRAEIAHGTDAHGAPTVEFAFPEVPAGEYELTLSALDSFRWHPRTLRVVPPAEGLSFLRYDRERALPLSFRVLDAKTREPITDFEVRRLQVTSSTDNGVFLHTGPIALGTFAVDGPFQWSLWADGHAPAFGDETCFVEKDGARVAEVLLQRGWSTKVFALARDPTARALAKAEVYVDGRFAGRTGDDGMVVVAATEPPKKLEVRAGGFALRGDPLQGHGGRRAEQRGHVTLAFLERER